VARRIGKASFGELNIPVITINQMVGVTERQRIGRVGYADTSA
jgi:hypothetical protein